MTNNLFAAVLFFLPFHALSQCEDSIKDAEKALGKNFIADPHVLQATMQAQDSLAFESLWLEKNTYRIATSGNDHQRVSVLVYDENNTIVFDNSAFGSPPVWDFFVEHSMKVRCVVRFLNPTPQSHCLTVLTGFKK
jgi:hypothetical protein